jgi:uncharacterized protein (DUF1501 family)
VTRRTISRRRFLAGSMAFGGACAAEVAFDLGWLGRAHAADAGRDYKALVCVLLAGGADSYNMLVPMGAGYLDYIASRADLALPFESLRTLGGSHQGGQNFGVHPALAPLADLFDAGELAFVANAGSLVEPATVAGLEAGSIRAPLGLYSHSDQIDQWQTAIANDRSTRGVGGRLADLLGDLNVSSPVSMNVSVSGSNRFQGGAATSEYVLDPRTGGAPIPAGYGEREEIVTPALDSILEGARDSLLRRTYGNRLERALESGTAVNAALEAAVPLTTSFGTDPFGRSMELIARVIAAREALGARRQTFFVQYGGWDHHDEVLDNMARMLPSLAAGLVSFRNAMVELGVHDDVTTFSISDFGRTLTSNGRGSDHGWGGNQMVMGGAVNGRAIHGTYPSLAVGSELDTGRGRFVPTTSVDEYYAELALWFGVPATELELIVPNVRRFWTPVSGGRPVGFLG